MKSFITKLEKAYLKGKLAQQKNQERILRRTAKHEANAVYKTNRAIKKVVLLAAKSGKAETRLEIDPCIRNSEIAKAMIRSTFPHFQIHFGGCYVYITMFPAEKN